MGDLIAFVFVFSALSYFSLGFFRVHKITRHIENLLENKAISEFEYNDITERFHGIFSMLFFYPANEADYPQLFRDTRFKNLLTKIKSISKALLVIGLMSFAALFIFDHV